VLAAWQTRTCTLDWLRDRQDQGRFIAVLPWLKSLGLVPEGVGRLRKAKVKLAMDAKKIEVGYLASTAYEWDQLGASRPRDFLDAIELETAGSTKKDAIVQTLTELGRSNAGDEPDTYQYRLAL
jgi:hypothetical protein